MVAGTSQRAGATLACRGDPIAGSGYGCGLVNLSPVVTAVKNQGGEEQGGEGGGLLQHVYFPILEEMI